MRASRKAWNEVDDARLARLWNEGEMCLGEIAAAVGHPPGTTYERARHLGLKAPAPEGWELLSHAARRAGFEPQTLRRILHHFGGTIRRALTRPFTSTAPTGATHFRPHYIVHPREVDAAVEHWVQTETVAEAARRFGISRSALHRRLLLAGVKRTRPVGRPCIGARPEWRVTQEDVERALAIKVPMGRRPRGPLAVEEAPRHDRRRGSTAPSPTVGGVAEPGGTPAMDDRAQFVPPARPAVPEPVRLGGRACETEGRAA